MRLRKYKFILEKALPSLEIQAQQDPSNNNYYILSNSDKVIESLNSLSKLKLFENEIVQLRRTNLFLLKGQDIGFNQNEINIIRSNIRTIVTNGNFLLNFLNEIIKGNNYSFSIKLPNSINDFDSLENISKSLKQAISMPVHMLGGDVKFVDFDIGSLWIDLISYSNEIIEFLKHLADAAIVIWMLKKGNQKLSEYIKSLTLTEDSRKDIEKATEEKIKNELNSQTTLVIENTKKSITKEINHDGSKSENTEESKMLIKLNGLDDEEKGMIKNAIKELADALSKGTDITPALQFEQDKEEVLKGFPDTTKIDYTETKELPQNTESNSQE